MAATVGREDNARLEEFLDVLRDTLELAFFMHSELFGTQAGRFQAMWPKNVRRFQILRGLFEEVPTLRSEVDGFEPWHEEKLSEDQTRELNERLDRHGLTGDELVLKLDIFYSALLDFLNEVDHREAAVDSLKTWAARVDRPEPTGGILRGAFGNRIRSALAATRRVLTHGLRQVLGAGDMVFDSLSDAVSFIPGAGFAAAAVKETKEAAEIVLTRRDEADRAPRSAKAAPGSQEPEDKHASLRRRITRPFRR